MLVIGEPRLVNSFNVVEFTPAPLRLARSAWLKAAQAKVFWLVSHPEALSKLIPWVRSVTMDNNQAVVEGGVGARRRCNFGHGLVLEETIVSWQPPSMYAYACVEETNPFGLTGHLGLVTCEADDVEETILTWRHYFDHPNPAVMQEKMEASLSMTMQTLINRLGGRLLETYTNFK